MYIRYPLIVGNIILTFLILKDEQCEWTEDARKQLVDNGVKASGMNNKRHVAGEIEAFSLKENKGIYTVLSSSLRLILSPILTQIQEEKRLLI